MNNDYVIQTFGLTRYFGRRAAVYEINLNVPRGGVFAFLGRNGSGKSTLIRMLLGLLEPTRGEGCILGCDIRHLTPGIKARIGYLTEEHQVYGWMTVRECSEFQSQFYPRWKEKVFRGVIDYFNLKPDARVRGLSRGERAGLCLGLTLAPDPELLILDDPTLGLDPVARRSLVESMISLTQRSDRTIFFSTHQLDDLERVADNLAILDQSILRACCPLNSFRDHIRQVRLQFEGAPPPLPSIPGLLQAIRNGTSVRLICARYNESVENTLRTLAPADINVSPISLEEALISYLGRRGEKTFNLPETEERV